MESQALLLMPSNSITGVTSGVGDRDRWISDAKPSCRFRERLRLKGIRKNIVMSRMIIVHVL